MERFGDARSDRYQSYRTLRMATATNTNVRAMVDLKSIFSMPRRTRNVLSACPKTLGFIPRACKSRMTMSVIANISKIVSNHTLSYRRLQSMTK